MEELITQLAEFPPFIQYITWIAITICSTCTFLFPVFLLEALRGLMRMRQRVKEGFEQLEIGMRFHRKLLNEVSWIYYSTKFDYSTEKEFHKKMRQMIMKHEQVSMEIDHEIEQCLKDLS